MMDANVIKWNSTILRGTVYVWKNTIAGRRQRHHVDKWARLKCLECAVSLWLV